MRKNNPRKWGMTLIAIVSVTGSYFLFHELFFPSVQVANQSALVDRQGARLPASAPQIDHMSSSKDDLDKLMAAPRAPAQVKKLSPDLIKNEMRWREIQQSGKKVRLILDIAVVSRRKAVEWGIPMRAILHNQAVIDLHDLPQGEAFQQLLFDEKKMSYSVLTNNLKFKVKHQNDFETLKDLFLADMIVGEFPGIRLFIVDAKSDENASKLFEMYQNDSRFERVEREIIDRSPSAR